MDLIVIAKEPVPGRVKTRLCPPLSPAEAAAVAAASLADCLDAAVAAGADRVVLALDGAPGDWVPPGVVIVDQGGGGLDERLGRAWSHAAGPFLQVGMDTPQLTGPDLAAAAAPLTVPGGPTAVLGPASDGGWWGLGLRTADPSLVRGVPTSLPDTGARQRARLEAAGHDVHLLPTARDVDTFDDARAVAALAPETRFARCVEGLIGAHA